MAYNFLCISFNPCRDGIMSTIFTYFPIFHHRLHCKQLVFNTFCHLKCEAKTRWCHPSCHQQSGLSFSLTVVPMTISVGCICQTSVSPSTPSLGFSHDRVAREQGRGILALPLYRFPTQGPKEMLQCPDHLYSAPGHFLLDYGSSVWDMVTVVAVSAYSARRTTSPSFGPLLDSQIQKAVGGARNMNHCIQSGFNQRWSHPSHSSRHQPHFLMQTVMPSPLLCPWTTGALLDCPSTWRMPCS